MSMHLESVIEFGKVLDNLYKDLESYETQNWDTSLKNTWSDLIDGELTPIMHKMRVKQIFYSTDTIINSTDTIKSISKLVLKVHQNFNESTLFDLNLVNKLSDEIKKLERLEKSEFVEIFDRERSESELDELMYLTNLEINKLKITLPDDFTNLLQNYLNYNRPNKVNEIFNNYLDIYNYLINNNKLEASKKIRDLYDKFIIFEQKRLNDEVARQLEEAKEIAQDVKLNITKNSNSIVIYHYSEEAEKLKSKIERLNKIIILIFLGIVLIFSLKSILLIFFNDSFNNIFTFITFLSIVFTLSALLTYLIKDYNQTKNLYDFYNIRYLELNALPTYMNELSVEQRKDLLIKLAPIYFIGAHNQNSPDNNDVDFSSIDKKLEEITKIVTKLKDLTK
ncbi:hypothetical protein [Acinetobacter pittii]|uniref:hypothetical protein n=1 Tax=Acinetobacter pittii TaxID=48296 RepID=UPI003AA88DF8